jgi:hypothetical protein
MIIILLIVLIFILIIKDNNIEHYDERLTNTTFDQCAKFCKTTANCYGFGFDRQTQTCYPSRSTIVGKPLDPSILFKDYYSPSDATCNKVNPITEAGSSISFEKRRDNSVSVCTEREGLHPQWYLQSHDQFINIGEGKNIDEIFDIDDYTVNNYRWPVNKYDTNNLDLLINDRSVQELVRSQVTDINRVRAPPREPTQTNVYIEPAPSGPVYNFDFGLDRLFKREPFDQNVTTKDAISSQTILAVNPTQNGQGVVDALAVPNGISGIANNALDEVIEEETIDNMFTVYDDYNTGEYLRNYKCVDGIGQKACLSYCAQDAACSGVEWNPNFARRLNVCCPKRSVGGFIPRVWMHGLGKFYLKNNNNNNNKLSGDAIYYTQ